jgi:hypothetical protein
MKKNLLFVLLVSFMVFSCNGNKNTQPNYNIQDSESLNYKPDTTVLATDYLFNNLENSLNQFIFTLSFRDQKAIFSYRDKNRRSLDIFSATFIKKSDTIFFNKWDILSDRFLANFQVPTRFLLLQNGDLKVIKTNSNKNNEPEVVEMEDGTIGLKMPKTVISKKSDIFKASTYDSMIYYTKNYNFKKDDFQYESPCSDMDSYYLGISYARDQLGGGLLADCDYLYKIAITQRDKVDYYCFCKGVSKWLSDNNR